MLRLWIKPKEREFVVEGTDAKPELSVPEPPVQNTQPSGLNSGMPSNEEVEELMRYIRKSDYRVIDHLRKTPSKILIPSLLRDS